MSWVRKKLQEAAEQGGDLTDRERAILAMVADGATDQEMAKKLGLCAMTVKTHKLAMYRRLGAKNAAHAVSLGYQKGIFDQ